MMKTLDNHEEKEIFTSASLSPQNFPSRIGATPKFGLGTPERYCSYDHFDKKNSAACGRRPHIFLLH